MFISGPFTNYVSTRGGEGVSKMLTFANEGGGGVGHLLTLAKNATKTEFHPIFLLNLPEVFQNFLNCFAFFQKNLKCF